MEILKNNHGIKELEILQQQINENSDHYETAKHLIESLSGFEVIDDSLIPENSLMREFIGGGNYVY